MVVGFNIPYSVSIQFVCVCFMSLCMFTFMSVIGKSVASMDV